MLEALGRAIVTGEFDAKLFPTEAELTTKFAVSRSVTREAVKMLTAKGLLSARPRLGTIVEPEEHWNLFDPDVLRWLLERKFSLRLLREFTELRLAIEPAAAELAARVATSEGLARIDAAYSRMASAQQNDDSILEADIAFHAAVLLASGNPFYAQFRPIVETALKTSIRLTNRYAGRTASLPAHEAVKDAIEAGDSAEARAAMNFIVREVMLLITNAAQQEFENEE